MSVAAEREPTGDLREIELRRHLQIMARSLERAEPGSTLTMVLRSPSSDPAKALIGLKGALKRTGLGARVILAQLDHHARDAARLGLVGGCRSRPGA